MRNLYYVRTLGGMPIRIHYTWLILALLGLVVLPGVILPSHLPDLGRLPGVLLALLTLALYGGVVALRVLVQIGVARLFHTRLPVLNVYPLGLVTRRADRQGGPKPAFWIAASGPIASFALWWVLDGIATGGVLPSLWMAVALYITGQLSFYLGLFSLLPGLPTDGGRMLRAIIWLFSGSFESGTRFARIAGQVIAYGLIFLGASSFVADGNWVRAGAFILIGWSIREAGGTAYRRSLVASLLTRLTAGDLMRSHERTVTPEQSLRAFARTLRGRTGVEPTPVVGSGVFLGMIDRNMLRDVPQGYWDTRTIAETMTPAANLVVLEPDMPLNAFVTHLIDDAEQAVVLPVVRDGKLVGLIDPEELIDVLELEDEFGVFARRPSTAANTAPEGRTHMPMLGESDAARRRAVGQ